MIANTNQLNEFIEKNRVKNTRSIIPMLVERGELVSANIANLITDKLTTTSITPLKLVK